MSDEKRLRRVNIFLTNVEVENKFSDRLLVWLSHFWKAFKYSDRRYDSLN